MRRLFTTALLALLSPAAPAMAVGVALADGESLTFRVGWGIFGSAGEVTVSAEERTTDGVTRTHIFTTTATHGFIRFLYPFDGHAETIFDSDDGRMVGARAATQTRRKQTSATIRFNEKGTAASYIDHLRPERSSTLEVPEDAYPVDFITTLVQAREWDLQPGEEHAATVLFDDDFYELVIKAERVETIDTAWGSREAVLLIPRMPGDAKGMFAKGGEVRVWMSLDEEPLPLRFEVKLKVGTATALLTEYRAPDGAADAVITTTPERPQPRRHFKRM